MKLLKKRVQTSFETYTLRRKTVQKLRRGMSFDAGLPTDLAWAAGFFDGEGYIDIRKATYANSFNLRVVVSQVDPNPIWEFQRILGGRISPVKGYYGRRPSVQWYADGAPAGEVLQFLRPYLKHKATQADVAIEFQRKKNTHRGYACTPEEIDRGIEARERLLEIRASFGRVSG